MFSFDTKREETVSMRWSHEKGVLKSPQAFQDPKIINEFSARPVLQRRTG